MKFTTKQINIKIPVKALHKLNKYGFDWERNVTQLIHKVYMEICYYEDHPEEDENNEA